MKRILCFGDSNTWGCIPRWEASPLPSERYDAETRWPCVMASMLGENWELIEEGLGGRTTIYSFPGESYRYGDRYLHPCMLSHRPLDYIVLMLGTNDLQPRMHPEPFKKSQMKEGLIKLIQLIHSLPECGVNGAPSRILVIAPPPIKLAKGRPEVSEKYGCEKGVELSLEFGKLYKEVAEEYGCGFLDASLYAEAGDADGVHFTQESHPALGIAIAEKILEMEKNRSSDMQNSNNLVYREDIEM